MKPIIAFALVAALFVPASYADELAKTSRTEFVRPFPIVALAADASDAHKAAAQEIADAVGVSVVIEVEKNPVCCIWVEVTGWTPNPGVPGYFIINQSGGSIISASDEKQLKTAVEQFKRAVRKRRGRCRSPAWHDDELPNRNRPGGRQIATLCRRTGGNRSF
jgi:hypothetical protein